MWATPLAHAHQLVEQATSHSVSYVDKLVDTLDLAVTTHLPGLSLSLNFLLACPRSPMCLSAGHRSMAGNDSH